MTTNYNADWADVGYHEVKTISNIFCSKNTLSVCLFLSVCRLWEDSGITLRWILDHFYFSSSSQESVRLPDGNMIVMGKETFLAPEIMFQVEKALFMPRTIFFNWLLDVCVGSDICVCTCIADVRLDGHGSRRVCQGLRLSRIRIKAKASQGSQFPTKELFLHGPQA